MKERPSPGPLLNSLVQVFGKFRLSISLRGNPSEYELTLSNNQTETTWSGRLWVRLPKAIESFQDLLTVLFTQICLDVQALCT